MTDYSRHVNEDGDEPGSARTAVWVDGHCHIDAEADLDAVIAEAEAAGVIAMVCVGTDVESSRRSLDQAARSHRIWATAGVHPHEAALGISGLEDLVAAAQRQRARLVAIGECGLDYHYDHSPRDAQREVFANQIGLAHRFGLPLVIHTRSAWDDTFTILDSEGVPDRTVFHCFTGGPGEAERALERGAHLSISGIVTFPSADDVRAAVASTPLESLMVETDSPYLAPVPYRGRRNTPAKVAVVGAAVAAVIGSTVETVAAATTSTAAAFYGIGVS